MFKRWLKVFKLWMNPPKSGEVYLGDSFDYIVGKPMEQILYGMRDRDDQKIWEYVIGPHTYKVIIESAEMPYYVASTWILARKIGESAGFGWLERCHVKRIPKETFRAMILDGRLVREDDPAF